MAINGKAEPTLISSREFLGILACRAFENASARGDLGQISGDFVHVARMLTDQVRQNRDLSSKDIRELAERVKDVTGNRSILYEDILLCLGGDD